MGCPIEGRKRYYNYQCIPKKNLYESSDKQNKMWLGRVVSFAIDQ